jgi:hypothetical protein
MVQADSMSKFMSSNYIQIKASVSGGGAVVIIIKILPAIIDHHILSSRKSYSKP